MLYILYTEEEGGEFHYFAKHTDEETRTLFDEVIKSKRLNYQIGDRIINISPAYIVLGEAVADFDFVLGKTRMETKKEKEEDKNDQ